MLPEIKGSRVSWVFYGPNFDIDLIIGVANIKIKDLEVLKNLCMKGFDENFNETVQKGDVLVGGENFGYGHPHPPAFKALKALGVIAAFCDSFSPGFYRAETSDGFALIECPGISKAVARWDEVDFDWDTEVLTVRKTGQKLQCSKIPQKTKDLVAFGGMIGYIRERRLAK
mgnify:CR=1 FL=1